MISGEGFRPQEGFPDHTVAPRTQGPFQIYVVLLGTLKVFLQKDLKGLKNSVKTGPPTHAPN